MPIPADAPALSPPPPPPPAADADVFAAVELLVVLDDDTEAVDDNDEDAPETLVEVDVVAEVLDVVLVSGSVSSPNTLRPPLRSSPMRLNVALFSPSIPSLPVGY